MQPDSISSLPTTQVPDWNGAAPVFWEGRHYTTKEVYAQGLAGRPLAEASEALGVPAADLRTLLARFPAFQRAYDDGWADWEVESLKRTEVSLALSAEGHTVRVKKVKISKDGLMTRYEEEEYYPPAPTSLAFRLERRDRPRFGKDVREEAPGVGQAAITAAAVYLMERGLGAIKGLPEAPQ